MRIKWELNRSFELNIIRDSCHSELRYIFTFLGNDALLYQDFS